MYGVGSLTEKLTYFCAIRKIWNKSNNTTNLLLWLMLNVLVHWTKTTGMANTKAFDFASQLNSRLSFYRKRRFSLIQDVTDMHFLVNHQLIFSFHTAIKNT